ncbi:DNA-binding transcriptional LysR family regulator [Sporomusaceae bacterium BoRhaA]|uniref:LysR family transcriptional regulator n=1 Tax=Pelorhabdus rhamnosifermentans TaxID=2772457 RepID=UPI001C062163|nr:LysR family transcriptional regulator [Pelorhabdus rhamnosifermentans]MBU2703981.1 DNA-binding transcriptional LysR family regulator [Pelorhabdus rhamnosifermentans]
MDERDFKLLTTLNKTRNITQAADILYISQSSLSKRIRVIERELGVSLMLRSRQGIHFTAAGEAVLKHTSEAAKQLALMRKAIEASRNYVCGTLKAGVSINYALYCLPDLLASYQGKYPHVNTHITTDQSRNLYLQLQNGVIDIAILRGEYDDWKGEKNLLDREGIYAIYSQQDEYKSLTEIPYIGRKTDADFERELAQWMHENNIRIEEQGIYVDNITTCVEMVRRGLGWGIVPKICLKDFNGCVRPLFFANGEPLIRSTYIMYSIQSLDLPQVKAFIDLIRNPQEEFSYVQL